MTLLNLMTQLRTALSSGEVAGLADIGEKIEAALPDLADMAAEDLSTLARIAGENARHLDAARQGIKSARRRLAEIAAAEHSLTYDSRGSKSGLSTGVTARRL